MEHACAKLPDGESKEFWNTLVPKVQSFPMDAFLSIGFSHHRLILQKVKNEDARIFYVKRCASEQYSYEALGKSIAADDYHHQGNLPNNFAQTLSASQQALKAIGNMSDKLRKALPDIEDLKKLPDENEE